MKPLFRKIANLKNQHRYVKKFRLVKNAFDSIVIAVTLIYGSMNSNSTPPSVDSGQYTERVEEQYSSNKIEIVDDDQESLTENQSVNSIQFKIKTGSGDVIGPIAGQYNSDSSTKLTASDGFEDNERQVILVKNDGNPIPPPTGGSGPSNFPIAPPSGGRPSPPATGTNTYTYRPAPKIVDQGLGAGANPAGAGGGGGTNSDDQSPVPKKEQSQKSKTFDYDYTSNDPKNKKKSEDQCPIDQPEVNESFKSNSSLKKVTKRALANQDVKREYKRILKRIGEGVDPMDISRGSTDLGDGLTYVRGKHGRYVVKNDNGVKDIVGIAYRGSRTDMKTLAKEMNKSYNVKIEPGGY